MGSLYDPGSDYDPDFAAAFLLRRFCYRFGMTKETADDGKGECGGKFFCGKDSAVPTGRAPGTEGRSETPFGAYRNGSHG